MSLRYQTIAVKADVASVRASLYNFAQSFGGHANTITNAEYSNLHRGQSYRDPTIYQFFTHEDWTIIEAGFGLMPALATQLSRDTQAEVFCLDIYEVRGYEHFSLLRAGEPIYIFTSLDDRLDMQGIDPHAFVAAIQPGEFKLAAGDDPAGEDFRFYAYGIFCQFIAPFDLEAHLLDVMDNEEPLECVRLDIPNAHWYQLGGTGPEAIYWNKLLAPDIPSTTNRGGRDGRRNALRMFWRRRAGG
jgi:hypothetical protein